VKRAAVLALALLPGALGLLDPRPILAAPASGGAAGAVAPDAGSTLVSYSFDDGQLATGPDTFAVFEKSKGRVHLSTEFRMSGYRSVQIRDVADDGAFPELQGYFPLRDQGRLYAHFALLVVDPREQLNVALAGPEWFTMRKGGIAFWLQTRGGFLYHYSDSMPKRLFQVWPFTWYVFDVAYDIVAGVYDLTIREEGRPQPAVLLKGQPNAFNQPGSAVDKFSFIGDNGHDTSNVEYYVDDVMVTVDVPIPQAPFLAPGRRKLFMDEWNDAIKAMRAKPACLPVTDLGDFGFGEADIEVLKGNGGLATLAALLNGGAGTASAASPASPSGGRQLQAGASAALRAVALYNAGCAALGRGDAQGALEKFETAARLAPGGRIYDLSAVLALAAAKRWDAVAMRMGGLASTWGDDPRFGIALARLGVMRGSLDEAEQWLRRPAESMLDDFSDESVRRLWAGEADEDTMRTLRARFPEGWQRLTAEALAADEYFYLLLWKRSFDEAMRYAERVADRLEGLKATADLWVERQGDAAFLAGDHRTALRRYETVRGAATLRRDADQRPWLLLKISDVQFLLGNLDGERACREAIYGSLHEDKDHPSDEVIEIEVKEGNDAEDTEGGADEDENDD
jgi:tetratricopeptide (TPR) repeat protein